MGAYVKKKTIECGRCGKTIKFKGGKHRYCDECIKIVRKEQAKLSDWKRVVARRQKEAKERLCKCPACGVEFSRLSQGSKKKYCGSEACELERCRRKAVIAGKNQRDKIRRKKDKVIQLYANQHKIDGIDDSKFNGDKFVKVGRNLRYSDEYVNFCLNECGYKLLSEFKNSTEQLTLECPNGHIFKTNFSKFLKHNRRCNICKAMYGISGATKGELWIHKWLTDAGVKFFYRNKTLLLDLKLEVDFYIPEAKLAIELCGLYWHSEIAGEKDRKYHRSKYDACCKKGVRLMTIFYDEIIDHTDIIKSRILSAIGCVENRIYARKTVCNIVPKEDAKEFFNKYHLQGYTPCKFVVGLYFNNELIAALSIGSMSRAHTAVDGCPTLELKRLAFKCGVNVVGGASKMFKYAVKYINNNYSNTMFIKSFCDLRYAKLGKNVYDVLGFDLYDETKYTPQYVTNHFSKRVRNQALRKTVTERKTGLTEWQLRQQDGYDRIWDCGHRSYIFNLPNLR